MNLTLHETLIKSKSLKLLSSWKQMFLGYTSVFSSFSQPSLTFGRLIIIFFFFKVGFRRLELGLFRV